MKRSFYCLIILCNFAAASVFVSCKGRTADNMVPTGDTVEVVILQPTTEEADSITTDSMPQI